MEAGSADAGDRAVRSPAWRGDWRASARYGEGVRRSAHGDGFHEDRVAHRDGGDALQYVEVGVRVLDWPVRRR
jgi:hypothetical protein